MKNMLRKLAYAIPAFGALPALAEGESGDASALSGVITDVQAGLQSMATEILTAVGVVVVACLGFWGLRALVKWARAYFGK